MSTHFPFKGLSKRVDSAYDSVYDLLTKVSSKLICDGFFTKCVDIWLQFVSDEEFDSYPVLMQIIIEIVRRFVSYTFRGCLHVYKSVYDSPYDLMYDFHASCIGI